MRTLLCIAVALVGVLASGCGFARRVPGPNELLAGHLENPIFVTASNNEFVWHQVVDELDNYFKIKREERVRLVGNVLTEGYIETYPTVGATMLEPWREDSVAGFERTHATLQTIRRHARARVIPAAGGYQIEVAVFKELEDLRQPQGATVGDLMLRYDDSLTRHSRAAPDEDQVGYGLGTLGWIPLGRDISLEQTILANLRGRLPHGALERLPPHADVEVFTHER